MFQFQRTPAAKPFILNSRPDDVMIKVLHITADPSLAVRIANACEGMQGFDNSFVLLCRWLESKDVCACAKTKVKVIVNGSVEYRALLNSPADVIWVHGAETLTIRFVLAYKGKAKIAWSALGPDYAGYIGRSEGGSSLKLRLVRMFLKMHCYWMLPSEHVRFFRRVDFINMRNRSDEPAVRKLLSVSARFVCSISDLLQVFGNVATDIAGVPESLMDSKALEGTGDIEFDSNGGNGKMPSIHCGGGAGDFRLPANAFSRQGYIFAGWSLSREGIVSWRDCEQFPRLPFVNEHIKLFARWGKFRCTVVFHANNGKGDMPAFTFFYGVPALLPRNVFTRPGFTFKGWAHSADGKVIWGDGSPISEPIAKKGRADLFAVWSNELPRGATLPAGFYGIRFHSNDGTDQSAVFCFKYKVSTCIPSLTELGWMTPKCDFLGWALSPVGDKIVYKDGAKVYAGALPGQILDLYAIRRVADGVRVDKKVTVHFDANGGSGKMDSAEITALVPKELPKCLFQRNHTGFVFGGWGLSPKGKILLQDQSELVLPPLSSGKLTLYAIWEQAPVTIKFHANGGVGKMEDLTLTYGNPITLPANAFSRKGCEFLGWSYSQSGTPTWKDKGIISKPPVKNGEVTLFAKWVSQPKSRVRVLHIFSDWWLCDTAQEFFSKTNLDNYYVFPRFKSDMGKPFKVLKSGEVHEVGYDTAEYWNLVKKDRWDIVWVHGAWLYKCRWAMLFKKVDPNVKLMWTTWGFDYLRYGPQWLFGPWTTCLYARIADWRVVLKKLFMCFAYTFRFVRWIPHDFVRFLHNVDYYSVTVPTEDKFLRRLVQNKARRVDFHCVSEKKATSDFRPVSLESKNVLITNCSRPSCNHLDALALLSKEKDYDFWAPLSYGVEGMGPGVYGRFVAVFGRKKLGQRFHPLLGFVPLTEYLNIMRSCSAFIFAHRRMAALGNISMAIKRGGCVFMNPVNPMYKHLRQIGVVVYPLSRLKDGISNVVADFKPHQKENIKRFWAVWNYEVRLKSMHRTLAIMTNDVDADRKKSHYTDLWQMYLDFPDNAIKVVAITKNIAYATVKSPYSSQPKNVVSVQGFGMGNIVEIKANENGRLKVILSGVERYMADGCQQKVMSRFKAITIDGRDILHERTDTWFGDTQTFEIDVKKGHKIKIKIDAFTNDEWENTLIADGGRSRIKHNHKRKCAKRQKRARGQ